jgi:hypothetical protein
MKIISENSDAKIAKNRAREDLRWPLRRLTANLIRIVRGAGSPDDFAEYLDALVAAYQAYREAFGHWPDGREIQQALAIDKPSGRDDIGDAREMIVKGALRLVAARLLNQNLQAGHGKDDITTGIRHLEEIREENRRQRRAELGGKRSPKRRPFVL